jgi:hypothetical protein
MTAESAGARARHIDEHGVDGANRRCPRVSDERIEIGRLESTLVHE